MESEWEQMQQLDREAEEKRFAALQRDAERERLMWLSMPGNDHPTYYSDSDADGYPSDAPSPANSVSAAATTTESDPYLHYAAEHLRREEPSTSSFRPIPTPGPAQRYRNHPALAAEEEEQTRVLIAQKVLHGNRTGNRGNKLRRKEGVRYASRGKLSIWNDGKTEKEMTDSAKQRTKALQRASIRSLLDSAPPPTPSPPLRPQRLPEDWPEPEESNIRGGDEEESAALVLNGAGPSSERPSRRNKARATTAASAAAATAATSSSSASRSHKSSKVKAEQIDPAVALQTSLQVYPWLRSGSLGKMAGPFLEDYRPDHDPAARSAHLHASVPHGQRLRKRRMLQAAILAATSPDGHMDPSVVEELAEAFAPQETGDMDGLGSGLRSGGAGGGIGGLGASGTSAGATENLSSTSLAPTLLRPVLTPLALLESQTLRHTFRNPHIGALSKTALDLIESESVVSRALGRCFAAIESGGMPGWGAYLETEERARKRRKVDEKKGSGVSKGKDKAKATTMGEQPGASSSNARPSGADPRGPTGAVDSATAATRTSGVDAPEPSAAAATAPGVGGSVGADGPTLDETGKTDGDVSMKDDTEPAVKEENANAAPAPAAVPSASPKSGNFGELHDMSMLDAEGVTMLSELEMRVQQSRRSTAGGAPAPAGRLLSEFGPALTQLEHLFVTPGGVDLPLHHSASAGEYGGLDGAPLDSPAATDAVHPSASMSGVSGSAGSLHTTHLDADQQRALVRAALECVYELAQDSREYVERLQEVREKLAQVRLGRARVWGAVRGWALGEVEDELERRRVERAQERGEAVPVATAAPGRPPPTRAVRIQKPLPLLGTQ
ncbi:hypothetical protein OC835_003976 [Tilletia horrida]|nr:hypothetical protein OC835_003976 [Tilletia horrida]